MPRTVDDLGDVVELTESPRRLVSLVPNLSELLVDWGLEDAVVGVTEYCVEPAGGFADALRVRGTKNPDTAAIIELSPDLVIANEEENRRLDVERLRAAHVPVYVTRVRTVADIASSVESLGATIGRGDAGATLRRDVLRALDEAKSVVDRLGLTGECAIWRNKDRDGADETWWLVGGASYAGDLLTLCGFAPAVRGLTERYPRVSLGELIEGEPDVVFLPDEPYVFTAEDVHAFSGSPVRTCHVDGTTLFWWGCRTPGAISWLSSRAAELARAQG